MGAAALFLFMSRAHVDSEYRPALLVSGLVVSIACYHYFMIRHSWHDAYALVDGGYKGTGAAFNDFYRYADWILTVPLLMVELVAVLRLHSAKATSLLTFAGETFKSALDFEVDGVGNDGTALGSKVAECTRSHDHGLENV